MDKKLHIAVCEDVQTDAAHLVALINESGIPAEICTFDSGAAFLASSPAGRYDLVFLDIYMGVVSGIEAAKALRTLDSSCGVVFTTSSHDHMLEAFDVQAEQYLIKPINQEKLKKALEKRVELLSNAQQTCIINARGEKIEVPLNEIYYVEVYNHNCNIHTANGKIETGSSMSINDFAQLLPAPRFLRCHKSYIVNLSYVESVDRDFIMKNGHTVYIRRVDLKHCALELDRWRLYEAGRD